MEQNIKIYSSSTWPHCKAAKEFLAQKHVDYIAYDVVKDKEALKKMREISGGAVKVPVISIGGTVMIGFDKEKVEQALNKL